jgi:glutathione S-transferase
VLAHTSPVYVDLGGRRVARGDDARWCLALLKRLEQFVGQHGHFEPATRADHLGDLVAVLDQARAFYREVAASADASLQDGTLPDRDGL